MLGSRTVLVSLFLVKPPWAVAREKVVAENVVVALALATASISPISTLIPDNNYPHQRYVIQSQHGVGPTHTLILLLLLFALCFV